MEDLQRFVARRVGDRERAADLTAEIFLAAIDSAHRYRRGGTPKAWLYGIARVVVAEDRRRRARERARRSGYAAARCSTRRRRRGSTRGSTPPPSSRRLYAAMDRLPEAERAVLELVAIDE